MNPPSSEIGSQLITLLASLMLVLQLLLVVQRMLITNIRIFALQSLLLAAIAGVVGCVYHASHVYVIAALTIIGKVLFLPWRLERLVRQIVLCSAKLEHIEALLTRAEKQLRHALTDARDELTP